MQSFSPHRVAAPLCLVWLLLTGPRLSADPPDYRAIGHDHYFNLEHDQAIEAYKKLIEQNPKDASAYNHLGTAIFFKELLRLGKLETSAFKGDNQFLEWSKPKPDPQNIAEFKRVLKKGREIAKAALEENPNDRMARYALSHNFGLHGNYKFVIEKAYFGALRSAGKARKHSKKLIEQYPDFTDGYLVSGVYEYVVGSLPWGVRFVVAFGGVSGSKKKGEEYVTKVAREGKLSRIHARSLLALLLRREKRPLEAAGIFEGLVALYPRNYVFHLELAAMYQDAGEKKRALEIFRTVKAKVKKNENSFARMPERTVKAVERKIANLEDELMNGPQTRIAAGSP